jgi:flagellar biosynthesis protein FlhF
MQQLSFADGWLSSCGAAAQLTPSGGEALLHQIQWLATQHATVPLVHLFEGGSQGLWRRIDALGVGWLTQVTGKTGIEFEECATTAGALAKTLTHTPITDAAALPQLQEVAGRPAADVVVWVGSEVIQLRARQQATMSLRLVSVRVVHRLDGSLIKTLYGVGNLLEESPQSLAAWLLIRAETRQSLRQGARIWRSLAPLQGAASLQKRALTAVQSGLAAWQLMQDSNAGTARLVAASLLGKRELTASNCAAALLKLFALKEMVGA